jgi:hypothetical protein
VRYVACHALFVSLVLLCTIYVASVVYIRFLYIGLNLHPFTAPVLHIPQVIAGDNAYPCGQNVISIYKEVVGLPVLE